MHVSEASYCVHRYLKLLIGAVERERVIASGPIEKSFSRMKV